MSTNLPDAFRIISTGVHLVGVAHEGRRNVFTAAWLMPVSFDPPLLALSINPHHASFPLLRASGRFAISVLSDGQGELARHFGTHSARDGDKLAGTSLVSDARGLPVLESAIACIDCDVTATCEAGDHVLVLGRVIAARVLDPGATPLLYADTGTMDGSAALLPSSTDGDPRA